MVSQYDAILMSNHGVVAYADTLHNAYMKMETVEHFAQIALVTHMLGRQEPLGNEELAKLMLARNKYQGSKSAAPMPLAAGWGESNGNHRSARAARSEESELTKSDRVGPRSR